MNYPDWKFIAALGATAIGIILSFRMSPNAVDEASVHLADAVKEYAAAKCSR